MRWWTRQIREGMNPRAYALVGVLLVVLLGVYALDGTTRRLRAEGASGAPAPSVAAEPASPSRAGNATPTPDGWGGDPFQWRGRAGNATTRVPERASSITP